MARKDKNIFTQARWNKGKMSQTELADIMNVTRLTIVNWEKKKNKPSVREIIKLSTVLDLGIEDLVLYYKEEK